MDLEALACVRAEEQLAAGAWRRTDRNERLAPLLCVICHGERQIRLRGLICTACAHDGWTGTPCASCGGRTTRRDAKNKNHPRTCAACRRDMDERGNGG